MSESYNICLDVGGTKVLGAIFNEKKEIVYRLKKKSKEQGDSTQNVEKVIISVVEEMIEESGIKKKDIHAISSSAPGVIDQNTGVVLFTPNLPWRNYDIRSSMEKKFGIPFYIGNDVNVVGFFVGTGMGGGLILNGELYTGNQFKGAEYGHMILDPEGPLCNCGQRGCLEAFSSKQGMSAYIRQQVSRGRKTMMADHVTEGVFRSKFLKKALKKQDAVTVEAVDRACHYLAIATGNMINTISPDLVIYGGGIIEAMGDLFLSKILAEVDRYCMTAIRPTVDIKNAALGDDSVIYGALALIEGKLLCF